MVWLGEDPTLSRKVAIKSLSESALCVDSQRLMAEARIASRLLHPNLVTLFEAGTDAELPYLVSEFVAGRTLRELIEAEGALAQPRAVKMLRAIVDGIAYAHAQGVGHYDLNPANVLVTADDVVKVMDFGLACESAHQDGAIRGTLRYMSPQRLAGEAPNHGCDVFALGAIFAEMLIGHALFDAGTPPAIVSQIMKQDRTRMLAAVPDLPPGLAEVLHTSLQVKAEARYPSAVEMKAALERADEAAQDAVDEPHDDAAVQFLLRKMTYQKGFAALSQNLEEIRRATSSDSNTSAKQLGNIIAKDVALMRRVLATANSAAFGLREVTSISKAVVMLGMERVRMCVTQALLEMQFGDGSIALKSALAESFFSALLATGIARETRACNPENAFVAANFHAIGRVLTVHYFPAEYEAIIKLACEACISEHAASKQILGVGYDVIGRAVGKAWKLPDSIVAAMRPLPAHEVPMVSDDDVEGQRLWCLGALTNAFTAELVRASAEPVQPRLQLLCERVAPVLEITPQLMAPMAAQAAELTARYIRLMNLPGSECVLLERQQCWQEALAEPDALPA